MSNIITFYDIPCKTPGLAWSPNTWKIRYCLNFKGVPYKTVWVEYPDIEALAKKIGAAPTGKRPDGSTLYTVPIIHDPKTNTVLSESILIAEYLDKTYPQGPVLLPPGTRPLQHPFTNTFLQGTTAILQFSMPATHKILTSNSTDYFRFHKEKAFGKTLETLTPVGPAWEVEWEKAKAQMSVVDGWLQAGKEEGPYFLGKNLAFVDFVVGARLIWLRTIFGENSQEWKDILTWNEGRWAKYVEGLKPYEAIL